MALAEPAAETATNLALIRRIDEQYVLRPYYGSRRMTVWLRGEGVEVNRKRVQRLMRLMGLEATCRCAPGRSATPSPPRRRRDHRAF